MPPPILTQPPYFLKRRDASRCFCIFVPMNNSLSNRFRRFPGFCLPLFGLFFIASCAGNGQPLTESDPQQSADEGGYTESYFDDSPSTGSGTSKKSAHRQSHSAGSYDSDGFSFKLPGGDWAIVGEDGVHESGVPYEFYNASTGRRAVLVEIELPQGEPLKLMDRAQMEMQTYEGIVVRTIALK